MSTIRFSCGAGLLVSLACLAGCSSGPRRVGVEGTVAYQGAPIKTGSIRFEPMDAAQGYSAGSVIKDGRYSIAAKDGLLPGKYSVKISSTEPTGGKSDAPGGILQARELLPEKYNTRTGLTQEVTASNPNTINFKLD